MPCTSNIISVLGDDGQLNFLNVTTKQPKVSLQIANKVKAITHFDIDAHAGKYLAAATRYTHGRSYFHHSNRRLIRIYSMIVFPIFSLFVS